jgi:hypothetical protein
LCSAFLKKQRLKYFYIFFHRLKVTRNTLELRVLWCTVIKQNKIQIIQGPKNTWKKDTALRKNIWKESTSTYFLNGYIQGG